MQIIRFDPGVSREITTFGSLNLALAKIAQLEGEAHVLGMHLAPGGLVGYHQAVAPQLFLVVQGEGWVRGEAEQRHTIRVGQGAFWQAGEWHAAGSETGLTAIVIEGKLSL